MTLFLAAIAAVTLFAVGCSKPAEGDGGTTGETATKDSGATKDGGESKTPPTATVDFAKDVQPTLQNYCLPCHGEGGKGGLNVTSADAKGMASKMAGVLESKKMPPANAPKALPDDERTKLVEQLKSLG